MLDVKEVAKPSQILLVAVAAQEESLHNMKKVCCVYTKDFRNLHVAAQEALLQETRTVCCVYAKDFRNLQETHEP